MISYPKLVCNKSRRLPIAILAIASMVLLVGGCDIISIQKSDSRLLAHVHDKYLYESDLVGVVQQGIGLQDSINAAENYINNWIKQQLLLHEAEANLTEGQKDFSKQLENYRSSLVIYQFESKIVRERLDTTVTKQELEEYFASNMGDFELKENIVKVNYVQIDIESKELRKLRNHWKSGRSADKTAIRQYCRKNGLNYSFDNDDWIYFSDFLSEVPIRTYNQEEFLKYNRNFEIRDSLYIYLVEFKDFKIKESTAPLSLQENIIRSIILNRRKLDLLQRTQDEIYDNGLKSKNVEIY
ncbi:MAG: hypothetical protein U1C46_04075 [Bacteroidales bacterium]|nr:hypothetical protein [Bacteroidales bacterium]MDZ4203980.1 hypothetical protein [Bacteroidales bacterium]